MSFRRSFYVSKQLTTALKDMFSRKRSSTARTPVSTTYRRRRTSNPYPYRTVYRVPRPVTYRRPRTEVKYRDENAPLTLNNSTNVPSLEGANFWHVMDENKSTNLTKIPQNTTATGRIGNVVTLRTLEYACNLMAPVYTVNDVAYRGECTFRISIVLDRQVNNDLNYIQIADVYASSAGTDYTNSNITQIPKSVPNMRRFTVLHERIVETSSDDRNRAVRGKIVLNRRNRYNGPDAEALQSGAIYLLITCFVKYAVVGTPSQLDGPVCNWQSRLTFTE